ncbi:hypothetical protein [Sagittula sp.]|uniref:hypothetical protein n=1 Tax=Sagittula sp. TaxID=2038081 RepID=UPI00351983DD
MEKKLALSGLHPGDVDVEDPNRVACEPLASGLVSLDIRQTQNTVPRKTPMERRPRQVRDRGLQGIEGNVQRQQRIPPERADDLFT